jgi:hypothetical protein
MEKLKLWSMIITSIYVLTAITIKIKLQMEQNWCRTQLQIMIAGAFKKNDHLQDLFFKYFLY